LLTRSGSPGSSLDDLFVLHTQDAPRFSTGPNLPCDTVVRRDGTGWGGIAPPSIRPGSSSLAPDPRHLYISLPELPLALAPDCLPAHTSACWRSASLWVPALPPFPARTASKSPQWQPLLVHTNCATPPPVVGTSRSPARTSRPRQYRTLA